MSTPKPRKRFEPPTVSIRVLREACGLNIPALVLRIQEQGVDVTADHISNCELGWKQPSPALMHAWMKALGRHPVDARLGREITDEVVAA